MRRPAIPVGSHLVSTRGLYSHHGIYIGRGKVVHYAGLADGLRSGPIERVTLEEFCDRRFYYLQRYSDPRYSGKEVVARVLSRLGETQYDVQTNNCEHLCSWAITDRSYSDQVARVEKILIGPTGMMALPIVEVLAIATGVVRRTGGIGKVPAKSAKAASVLVPASAWPYPTNSRP